MNTESPTRVIRMEIAYDGTNFSGWQIQTSARTVQGEVHKALERLLGRPTKVNGASRTDAGVHAMGQVVSFPWPEDARQIGNNELMRALLALLPKDVTVLRLEDTYLRDSKNRLYHARHCSRGKRYRYKLWAGRIHNPFESPYHWQLRRSLPDDAYERISDAARRLVGTHDFGGFRASDCSAEKTVRHLFRAEILRPGPYDFEYEIVVEGSAFLKYMVRIIVGTLMDVAYGRMEPDHIDTILQTADRTIAGQTAPPQGLHLEEIFYPDFPWKTARWSMAR